MQQYNNTSKISAILGPTNTGKTFIAFDKLLSYESGIFGFPLRLLARENYEKAIKRINVDEVALVTGEEKIVPKNSKYFFCTVESMPTNIDVECVVIDEIQMASDYERGYIFTDRILNSRGSIETIFLGSSNIKNVLLKLFPIIEIESKDRFSKLTFENKKNISKLRPRSAIIAFNLNKVYEIAELLRQHKGGAAVVLGSLSPRTRNAQVEVYENNNVDYLVATDAIGMGLNLNINHVFFSSIQKFDGKYMRNLYPSEIGQIAGRAGRYKSDGTFGFSKDIRNIDYKLIKLIENHNFQNIEKIYWRNSKIDFSSISSVLNSLQEFPIQNFFIHKKNAEDEINFRFLINDPQVKKYLDNQTSIKLLWEVCRIPDFQKIMNDNYIELLKNIFLILVTNGLKIPESWLSNRIERLNNFDGGIEELTSKIANIRTWTYISNHSYWLENNDYWKEKTRFIEDTLSDNLHDSLTNRFVDISATYFVNIKNKGENSKIEVDNDNLIKLNGQIYGYINGFNLRLENLSKTNSLFLLNHVKKSVRSMIKEKISDFINAPDDAISLDKFEKINFKNSIKIYWGDEEIGYLKKGKNIFSPIASINNSEFIESENKILMTRKLQEWIDKKILNVLKPISNDLDDQLPSNVRSIVFNLYNSLGSMDVQNYQKEIKNFNQDDKLSISRLGIRVGAKFFYVPNLLKKNPIELKAILWNVYFENSTIEILPLPKDGRVSFVSETKMPSSYWYSVGYINIKNIAVRIDVFERVFFLARQKIKFGPFIESSDLMNPIGCNSNQLTNILDFSGFDSFKMPDEKMLFFTKIKKIKNINSKKKKNDKKSKKKAKKILIKDKNVEPDPNSPFAVLQKLL
tara:strand:+ start:3132 stop:5702 length:2571 start_codon:yes stop_codon:yes gene_type:complete